jgi:hypothetical protein
MYLTGNITSATEPNLLMLCKLFGVHGCDCGECRLQRCNAVDLVRTNVSEECVAFMLRMERIRDLGTTLAVTTYWAGLELIVTANVVPSLLILSNRMMATIRSPEKSILASATRCHIPVDGILYIRGISPSPFDPAYLSCIVFVICSFVLSCCVC